ncbi:hypothetical protein [Mesorhizobium sp. M1396]|uniref:hypothetical protein n=1 Tax=Mesorhizobium sp. M1396 TaxID=2957095 RepID=UPI00333D3D6A
MDIMEPPGRMAADTELTNALERINRTELALERTEQMLAENIALRKRMRSLVEAARLVKIEQHQ